MNMVDNEYLELFRTAFRYFLKHEWNNGQKGFAAMIGVSETTISELKNAKANPSLSLAEKISNSFGFTLDDFFRKGREIKLNGKPSNRHEAKNNIYELPIKYSPPPVDERLLKLRAHLDIIFDYNDEDLITAIEMNLISFRKIVDNEKRIKRIEKKMDKFEADNLSLKEENEKLKKTINKPGG